MDSSRNVGGCILVIWLDDQTTDQNPDYTAEVYRDLNVAISKTLDVLRSPSRSVGHPVILYGSSPTQDQDLDISLFDAIRKHLPVH